MKIFYFLLLLIPFVYCADYPASDVKKLCKLVTLAEKVLGGVCHVNNTFLYLIDKYHVPGKKEVIIMPSNKCKVIDLMPNRNIEICNYPGESLTVDWTTVQSNYCTELPGLPIRKCYNISSRINGGRVGTSALVCSGKTSDRTDKCHRNDDTIKSCFNMMFYYDANKCNKIENPQHKKICDNIKNDMKKACTK